MTWFELPFPPSVNALTFNRKEGGRAPTKAYESWKKEAIPLVMLAATGRNETGKIVSRPTRVYGPYGMHMHAARPDDGRKHDLGNLWKALEDALVAGGMVEDDSLCERQEGCWSANVPAGRVRVLVLPTEKVT